MHSLFYVIGSVEFSALDGLYGNCIRRRANQWESASQVVGCFLSACSGTLLLVRVSTLFWLELTYLCCFRIFTAQVELWDHEIGKPKI
jgi:hypothetical protein